MLIPHSTIVTSEQALDLFDLLLCKMDDLDPAQRTGVEYAIQELRELSQDGGLDEQLDAARDVVRDECELSHESEITELEKDHKAEIEELVNTHKDTIEFERKLAREKGYEYGVADCAQALGAIVDSALETKIEDAFAAREAAELAARPMTKRERDALERAMKRERAALAKGTK